MESVAGKYWRVFPGLTLTFNPISNPRRKVNAEEY
jgi:hypothetical protein